MTQIERDVLLGRDETVDFYANMVENDDEKVIPLGVMLFDVGGGQWVKIISGSMAYYIDGQGGEGIFNKLSRK